ncbi:glutaredoxin family protein [Candidatus Saccharibacteria bacterium]|nr:glutaredoxin family protein [Candidatus Saccharibacteria bacterium]
MAKSNSKAKITVYSTMTCPWCFALKAWLEEKDQKFEMIFVDADKAAAQKMIQLSGQMGVPFSTIESEKGDMIKIVGFDRAAFTKALGL